ncbi:MAG: hypothetical protein JRF49_08015, partial [Deltaproteobacteria bacterium]|nr:hypothetical protein [Deltaproteobacteria bacterium]
VVSLEKWVPKHTNLKINLTPEITLRLPEAYAKVVSVDPSDTTSTKVRGELEFTSLPEDVKNFFDKKRSG